MHHRQLPTQHHTTPGPPVRQCCLSYGQVSNLPSSRNTRAPSVSQLNSPDEYSPVVPPIHSATTPITIASCRYAIPSMTVLKDPLMRSPKIQNLQGSRRLRPLRSYFKRPKSSPVRPLACNRYYCVQFTAKPKAACALRFSWAATSSNLSLGANMTSFMKPEVHNVSIRRQTRTEPRSRVACTKNW